MIMFINNFKLESKDITQMYELFDKCDANKDGYLNHKELFTLLKENHFIKSQIHQIILRFSDENNNNLISITNLVFTAYYFLKILNSHKITKHNFLNVSKFESKLMKINSLPLLSEKAHELQLLTKDYKNLIFKGYFSGLIINSKIFEVHEFKSKLEVFNLNMKDMITSLSNIALVIIARSFMTRLEPCPFVPTKIDMKKVQIPWIHINIIDNKEIVNLENISNCKSYTIILIS